MTTGDLSYDVVDVFAESPYAGNQLAVVHGADRLSDAQMLAIAREFNYSETSFPVPRDAGRYAVRIFTPGGELPFAGHPTLGTAWVLRENGLLAGGEALQECAAGQVGVRFTDDLVELSATPREPVAVPGSVVGELLGDHGLGPEDQAGAAWVAGAGLNFLHVPVRPGAVVRSRPGGRALTSYAGMPEVDDPVEGVNLVTIEKQDGGGAGLDVHARVFAPEVAVPEDAATGSAAAGLGIMLAVSGRLPDGGTYAIRQGIEMGRPSLLLGRVEASSGRATRCHVAGRVQPVASGRLRVPPR
jgi:trans-2,3-dihydro-3-hydroxyanthranilate isomerase